MRDFANSQVETWLIRFAIRAGVAVLFAAVLAFLAPFGTYRFSVIERIGYWTLQMVAWLALWMVVSEAMDQSPKGRRINAYHRIALRTVVSALAMVPITGLANNMMTGWQPDLGEALELFVSITLIGGAHAYISGQLIGRLTHYLVQTPDLGRPVQEDQAPIAHSAEPSDPTLLEKLPSHLRTDILSLQGEDHYVRVHARHGDAMVLMRFSDALKGIDHIPGIRVHRSWWVAENAVKGFRKVGRTASLTLANQISVPVSQPYLADADKLWGEVMDHLTASGTIGTTIIPDAQPR